MSDICNLDDCPPLDGSTVLCSPICSSKRKLIDAKLQDENYQKVVVTSEITKSVSKRIVENTLQTVMDTIRLRSELEKHLPKNDASKWLNCRLSASFSSMVTNCSALLHVYLSFYLRYRCNLLLHYILGILYVSRSSPWLLQSATLSDSLLIVLYNKTKYKLLNKEFSFTFNL